MANDIPDYKTMKKLARRHMEDHEPERWKKQDLRLFWYIVPVIFITIGLALMLQITHDVNVHEYEGTDYVQEYGLDGARILLLGSAGVLGIGLLLGLMLVHEFNKTPFNWVDYYFEKVHQDQDQKGDD